MQWITEEKVFAIVLSDIHETIRIDARLDSKKWDRLMFDSLELCTRPFVGLLQSLMHWSGDEIAYYIVLNPDPIRYFAAEFKKYPLLEIRRDDSCEAYLAALNEDPGGSPADAVGINWDEYGILPPSVKWLIRGFRDDGQNEGGQLWIPREWTQAVMDLYPYARAAEKN